VATPIEVLVPDIGGFKDVSVIEVHVKAGQQIDKESALITIETEKAAMDVPAPTAGAITEVKVKQGDKVSEGSLILMLRAAGEAPPAAAAVAAPPPEQKFEPAPESAKPEAGSAKPATGSAKPTPAPAPARTSAGASAPPAGAAPPALQTRAAAIDEIAFSKAYASPSVRKFARELGADLGRIEGTGPKGRITPEDVKAHVKRMLIASAAAGATAGAAAASAPGVTGLPKVPEVDFAKFGETEVKPLSRIQRISGARLQASWINLPHVTQYDEADITDLEAVRGALKNKAAEERVKLTPLVFIIRACIAALQKFPRFNASLDPSGENLVLKKYFHIGFAADTPNGLVVPVIRDADRLDIYQMAARLGELSEKARAGKLTAADMQGGSFTISSLGGIGGTAFTPIINAPEVAILGVAKSSLKPVYERGGFIPRLMLPLCLSYDHRVIDGAEAARFIVYLTKTLGDIKALI
jgi:pyruvate dehydrogenase E2 component (dihydrolipoamide acetyltransferase)